MESRVLTSRGPTISGIPRLTRINNSNTLPAARINAGEGGNLVWGRQLRPSLLLNNHHDHHSPMVVISTTTSTTKRGDLLKPCAASDSAG